MSVRQRETTIRAMLANPALVDSAFKQKRWAELAALVKFARRDVPPEMAQTDPALYCLLREQITRFYLLGGAAFSLPKLEKLARRRAVKRRAPRA